MARMCCGVLSDTDVVRFTAEAKKYVADTKMAVRELRDGEDDVVSTLTSPYLLLSHPLAAED